MNSFIETLNQWGENFLGFAGPMFWQSSLLIAVLLAFDFLFRRKLRASLRYALWLVVLVKLCVPTTLASPTSPAWWLLRKTAPPPVVIKPAVHYTVTYDNTPMLEIPQTPLPVFVPPKPAMTLAAWLLVISASISGMLLLWLLVRWWQITRQVRRAATSERLVALAGEARQIIGMKLENSSKPTPGNVAERGQPCPPASQPRELADKAVRAPILRRSQFKVQVKLTANSMSPAVCGLFRPAILIPQSLADNFSDRQLRAVLLHELIHLRRRDVWLNFVQALLQIFYWWHPLLWLANARIRRVREEAVDDAVMLALRDEAEAYAPTLLEVAKLALNRPLVSLGLVGIMESRHALRQRIERLVDFRPPRRAGLTLVSLLGILAFTAVAVPMGEGPAETNNPTLPVVSDNLNQTNSNFSTTTNSFEVKTNASQLVQDAKLLYEMGKLDEAETKFKAALALDPENTAAKLYLGFVQAARQQPKLINSIISRQAIMQKLQTIRMDLEFDSLPLSEVIQQLSNQVKLRDPDKKGINFMINNNNGAQAASATAPNPLGATKAVDPATGLPLAPAAAGGGQAMDIRQAVINLNPALTNARLADVLEAIVQASDQEHPIKYSVMDYAIVFSPKGPDVPELFTRTFKIDPNTFYQGLQSVTTFSSGTANTNGGNSGGLHPVTSPDAQEGISGVAQTFFRTLGVNLTAPGKSIFFNDGTGLLFVRATEQDLDTIGRAVEMLDRIAPQNHEAATNSVTVTFKLDRPVRSDDLNTLLLDAGVTNPPTIFFYTENGMLFVRGSREQQALVNRLVMKLNGRSTNEIDAADKQFTNRTSSIGFETQATTNLYNRTFKVDPNTFWHGLQNQTGLQSTNVSVAARNFFSKLGVDLTAPGKAIFFNDRLGELFVRATEQDLDTIERAVQMLNTAPLQIHIKARFVEVTKDKSEAPNYDGYLGQFKDGKILLWTNSLEVFPGITTTSTSGSQNSNPTNATVTAVLTDTDSRVAFHYLTLRPGFENLTEPEAVTTSGRETQMRASAVKKVINNFGFPKTATITPQSATVEFDAVLDTVAYVLADGYTIDLKATASVTNFLGLDVITNTIVYNKAGQKTNLSGTTPRFFVRQASAHLNLWDGQTVVLGNLPKKFIVGGKEVNGQPDVNDKELLVFITVTIIDPAGNRVHADDELPFAQTGVPPQPPPK